MLALVAALGLGVAACTPRPDSATRDRILWDHNVARNARGHESMAVDDRATWYAQQAADRIRAESGELDCVLNHTAATYVQASYPGTSWAENIGCFPGCKEAAPNATPGFFDSPSHRDNILSDVYRRFGVGVACNSRYLFVAVQFSG